MCEWEEVHSLKHLGLLISVLDKLLLHLEHLVSFDESILFQFLIFLLVLELLEHAFLLSLHFCLFFHFLIDLLTMVTFFSLESLGFNLRKHVIVPRVVKYNSFGKAFVSLSLNESLEEGVWHSSSLRSGARHSIHSLGRLSITITTALVSHSNERHGSLLGSVRYDSVGSKSSMSGSA
jgi:hypothetical protein